MRYNGKSRSHFGVFEPDPDHLFVLPNWWEPLEWYLQREFCVPRVHNISSRVWDGGGGIT